MSLGLLDCHPFFLWILSYWCHVNGYHKRLPNLVNARWLSRISNGNRTEWSTIQGVIGWVKRKADLKLWTDYHWILRHKVLFPLSLGMFINVRERFQIIWIKVIGPVSFIHISFPVEAGQLGTWSQFFHRFWLVSMCYVVKFNWLVAFSAWFSLVF